MGGGGGSRNIPTPVYEPLPPEPVPKQRAVTAQPVIQLMSEVEERNKRFAAALLTQDWLKPPTLGMPGLQRKDVLGL